MNLVAVVPAQHHVEAQLLLFVYYKMIGLDVEMGSIFSVGASPTGETPPTHYLHNREVNEEEVKQQIKDQKRSSKSCKWAYTELVTDKETGLNNFSFMLMPQEEALTLLELKMCC